MRQKNEKKLKTQDANNRRKLDFFDEITQMNIKTQLYMKGGK